ncbi:RAMP superfamily CRISPR-associated protein [Paracidovorax wautersii]|uniref:CRISPR type IV/AFERR-associated protein Csf2 n=1 Tax=Paracidovorax wautersii TaxID=1177982 RepID=A0A1I2HPA6_9BURK|nr:RAMP superfamily CRISPR-associated protein [Paracidovorax wautersii]SFF31130.1 CRISPR type IV/AFERR-associated protein Csf2 [Paracidovorax wautersii]
MIVIHGVLTTTSPLHTSAGSKGLRLQRDGFVSSKDNDGIPVVSTVNMPLTVRGRYYGDVPIFPSSGIVGALRRHASRRVRAALTADGGRMSQPMYYAMQNGHAPAGQLSGGVATLKQYEASRGDLFFGMFGGGSMRNAARYIQSDLVPVIDQTIDAGLVPEKFADLSPTSSRGIEPWQLVSYRVMRKVDDIGRGRDSGVDVDLLDDDQRREAAAAYEVITPGTPLYFRTQLAPESTPEQRGLYLLALLDLLETQQLGGRVHLGWGGVMAQRFRYVEGVKIRHDLFEQKADDEGIVTLTGTPAFKQLVKPAEKALAAMAKAPEAQRERLRELLGA